MKKCNVCGETKPLTEYYTKNNKGQPVKYASRCKSCDKIRVRDWQRKKGKSWKLRQELNISEDDYNTLLEESKGRCNICNTPFTGKEPFIDHCHTIMKARGLLCNSCNSALGHVKDNPDILRSMIEYLK